MKYAHGDLFLSIIETKPVWSKEEVYLLILEIVSGIRTTI